MPDMHDSVRRYVRLGFGGTYRIGGQLFRLASYLRHPSSRPAALVLRPVGGST
jgi:hypothetical protein